MLSWSGKSQVSKHSKLTSEKNLKSPKKEKNKHLITSPTTLQLQSSVQFIEGVQQKLLLLKYYISIVFIMFI